MADNRATIIDLVDDKLVRESRGRRTVLARLDAETKTLYWKDADLKAAFRKSVDAFFEAEKITIATVLMEGQEPDVVPKNAPPCPPQHFMQGDCTPAFVDWLLKWKPIDFQNRYGVYVRALEPGEAPPKDPRELWLRAKVIRTDSRPLTKPFTEIAGAETHGGEYLATTFTMDNQIIARRKTHLTFEKKEVYKGPRAADQALPYEDPYMPEKLDALERQGKIEVISRRHAAASGGSIF